MEYDSCLCSRIELQGVVAHYMEYYPVNGVELNYREYFHTIWSTISVSVVELKLP